MAPCFRRINPAFWLTLSLLLIGSGLWLTQRSAAQGADRTAPLPPPPPHADHGHHGPNDNPLADVPFELRLDLRKVFASPLGQMVLDAARENKPNFDELLAGVTDTIGIDPTTGVGELVVSGKGINEMDLQLVADLGDTTGKLEGWMLTLNGYESRDLDDQTLLHSFLVNDDPKHNHDAHDLHAGHDGKKMHRLWVALPRGVDGRYTLVAAFNDGATRGLANDVLGGRDLTGSGLAGDEVLALRIHDLGKHGLPDGAPGSAVLESVESLALTLGSGKDVTAVASMTTTSAARARQVSQLLQGLIALGQLAAIEQPEAQPLADFLSHVNVRTDEGAATPAVSASFRSTHQQFEDWLRFVINEAH